MQRNARVPLSVISVAVLALFFSSPVYADSATSTITISAGEISAQDSIVIAEEEKSFPGGFVPWGPVLVSSEKGEHWYVFDYVKSLPEQKLLQWGGRLFINAKTRATSTAQALYDQFGQVPSNVDATTHLMRFIGSDVAASTAISDLNLSADYSVYHNEIWFDSIGTPYYRIDFVRYDSYSQNLLWGARILLNAVDGSQVIDNATLAEGNAFASYIPNEFDPVTKQRRVSVSNKLAPLFNIPALAGILAFLLLGGFLYSRFRRRLTLSSVDWAFILAIVAQIVGALILALLSPGSFLAGLLFIGALGTVTTWITTRATLSQGTSKQNLEVIKPIDLPKFSDIGGMESVKEEIRNTVGLIARYGDRASAMGIHFNGILLSGPPGVGKTFLARAIAGEYGYNFISVKASDVTSSLFGGSTQMIDSLFKKAADSMPCLIFFDDFDSVAQQRGEGGGVSTEDTRMVTELLASIEGVRTLKGRVIVMAATNDRDSLDEAIIRPGRFDKHIMIPLPDLEARRLIIERILKDKPLGKDIDPTALARIGEGMSAAEISTAIEKAAFAVLNAAIKATPDTDAASITISQEQLATAFRNLYEREKQTVRKMSWSDLVVSDETLKTLKRLVKLIEDPSTTDSIGIEAPRGVLLYGPPGTGKTTIARVIANEAKASFTSISAADIYSKWLGESEQKVKKLFADARKHKPSIVFIDEIDAMMRTRSGSSDSGGQYTDKITNQILQEIDGIKDSSGLFIIGATNARQLIDPALLRGGRLSEQIEIPLPGLIERVRLFEMFTQKARLDPSIDKQAVMSWAMGMSGADIKAFIQKAILDAYDRGGKDGAISQTDLSDALERVKLGEKRNSAHFSVQDKKETAYHEAGHALVAALLPSTAPTQKISIIARGETLGVTWSFNVGEDVTTMHRHEYLDKIAVSLGGYLAEKIVFGDVSSGASSDLKTLTWYAREMVVHYGMSEKFGTVALDNVSPETSFQIDQEVQVIIAEVYKKTETLLINRRTVLDAIAQRLLEKETIERAEFESILIDHGITLNNPSIELNPVTPPSSLLKTSQSV